MSCFSTSDIIFTDDKNAINFEFSDIEKTFSSLIEYYFSALQNPYPFLIEWINPIIDNDVEKLKILIKKTKNNNYFEDPYVNKALINAIPSQASYLIENFNKKAKSIFEIKVKKEGK